MIKDDEVTVHAEKIRVRYLEYRKKYPVEKSIKRILSENPQFKVTNLVSDVSKIAEVRIILYKMLMSFSSDEMNQILTILMKEFPGLMKPI